MLVADLCHDVCDRDDGGAARRGGAMATAKATARSPRQTLTSTRRYSPAHGYPNESTVSGGGGGVDGE